MDKYIKYALETWYPVTHNAHRNSLHPILGLAGEAGELIDLWKKHLFKPNFDAWMCKRCSTPNKMHTFSCETYQPYILDELGDLTYYLRILFYQSALNFPTPPGDTIELSTIDTLIMINRLSANLLYYIRENTRLGDEIYLSTILDYVNLLCRQLGVRLEEVMEMNYQKLSTGDYHGWKDAK